MGDEGGGDVGGGGGRRLMLVVVGGLGVRRRLLLLLLLVMRVLLRLSVGVVADSRGVDWKTRRGSQLFASYPPKTKQNETSMTHAGL